MNSKQRIAHEQQMAKNKAQRDAILKWFCNLNGLEKVITVVASSTLLLSTSYGLHCLSQQSDAEAVRQVHQEQVEAIRNIQQEIKNSGM